MDSEEKNLGASLNKPPQTSQPKSPLHSLRTYQGDIEETLSKNKTSISSIVIEEQKRRDRILSSEKEKAGAETKNKFYIILGVALLLVGIATVSFVYYLKSKNETVVQQKTKAMLGFSEEKILPATSSERNDLLSSILKEKESFSLPVNSVLYINTVGANGAPAPIRDVLSILAPRIPPSLARSVEDKYMFGVYSFDTNEPFIILSISDYAGSYAGMLKWETDLAYDLGPLFGIEQNATTTSYLFTDKAIKNKDIRLLQDSKGDTLLLYSFLDKNTLLITSNEKIFNAILGKYLVSKNSE